MNADGYAVTVTLFSLAYTLFEVPSNYVMKHYVRPSIWLGFLLGAWGALTIGFAGVQNYATVVALRFFIGAFEAGFFPGRSLSLPLRSLIAKSADVFRIGIFGNDLVSLERKSSPYSVHYRLLQSRRCFRWDNSVWRGPYEWCRWSGRLPMAFRTRFPPKQSHHSTDYNRSSKASSPFSQPL